MKKYTILKGWHYALFLFGRLFGWNYNKKSYTINFKFSKECWYKKEFVKISGLNKLGGISFGIFGIHKNSVRLSWVPNFDKEGYISLYGYVYDELDKTHSSKYICEVETEKEYECLILLNNKDYEFEFNIPTIGIIKMANNFKDHLIQKKNYPYFGGHDRSPQKMDIWLSIKGKETD